MTNQINSSNIVSYANSKPTEQNSAILSIPYELLADILNHLSYRDLRSFNLVSKTICWISSQIYSDNVFWKRAFYHTFSPNYTLKEATNFEHRFMVHSNLSQSSCLSTTYSTQDLINHSDEESGHIIGVFQDKIVVTLINKNEFHVIDSNQLTTVEIIRPTLMSRLSVRCVDFYNEMLVLGSYQGLIQIHDKKNNRVITHRAASSLSCLVSDPEHQRIISGHGNGDIIIWSLEDRIKTLHNPSAITALALDQERLIVGDEKGMISIFDSTKDAPIYQGKSYGGAVVKSLTIDGNRLFSVSEYDLIEIWDLKTLSSKETLTNSDCRDLTQLIVQDGIVMTHYFNNWHKIIEVMTWDVKTKKTTDLTGLEQGTKMISIDMDKGLLYNVCDHGDKLQVCDFTNPKRQEPSPIAPSTVVSQQDHDYGENLFCQMM